MGWRLIFARFSFIFSRAISPALALRAAVFCAVWVRFIVFVEVRRTPLECLTPGW